MNSTEIDKSNSVDPPLKFEIDAGVALLTLDRPLKGNSLTPDLLLALEEAWRRVDADESIRVAIITGAGERHFCTGAATDDLKMGSGGLQNQPYAAANRFSPRMCHVSKPVICVVNGLVNGGGLHFVADSDIVVACATADLMDTHVSVGQVSALESAGLVRRAGVGAALLMALTGRGYRMPAKRAHELGLYDLLEPTAAEAMSRARELAAAICANSPQAVALSKRAIWGATELADPAAAVFGWELLKTHWSHPDFEEGPRAFAERRTPNWNSNPNARR
ncbi:MAG: enoyl-CoA hydratase/isomerase family protein [Steroidobacteraceae bacterium]